MKDLLLLVLLLLVCLLTTIDLFSQRYGRYQRFISAGYTVPIEADRISDGIAHSLTGYVSLARTQKMIMGIAATAGFDLNSLARNQRQEMGALSAFGRYMIQNRNIKSYAEGMLGAGIYREVWLQRSALRPDEALPTPNRYFFGHLNLGGGVDIPFGDSDWHFGLGGSYAFSLHKEGTGAFFVPRLTISKY